MLTFQDYLQVPDNDRERAEFVKKVIQQYKSSDVYQTAWTADQYDRCRNVTTMQYQKMITSLTGQKYVDQTATVHRSCSNYYNIFCTQLNQYLLGNGITWKDGKEFDGDFDTRVQQAGKAALTHGVAYGFWNLDHLEVFTALEFAPLYDEENGGLAAGVRFWQIDENKPMRAMLYELDGVTSYLWSSKWIPDQSWSRISDDCYMKPKMPYKIRVVETAADGAEILDGENYPAFPVVPVWGNPHKTAELVGMREKIDAYDFILNGWEDDLDNAQLFWIISGAGGMDDPDLVQFLDRLRTVKAAAPMDGQSVTPVTVEIPVQAREQLLLRLEKQLYRDAMIMNPEDIASGAATATQIRAAYERQNVKADQYEYCVRDFLDGIMTVAGVDDEPAFNRSTIVNSQEEVQTVLLAASYLSEEYVTRKVLSILGDVDMADDIIKERDASAAERLGGLDVETEEQT